jgi:hypothetical protein
LIAAAFAAWVCDPAGLAGGADSLDLQMAYRLFQPLKVAGFLGYSSASPAWQYPFTINLIIFVARMGLSWPSSRKIQIRAMGFVSR